MVLTPRSRPAPETLEESSRGAIPTNFLNFFNHANFAALRSNIDRGDVGRVRNAADARQIQFGIKYAF